MFGIIATWRMSLEGLEKGYSDLKNNKDSAKAVIKTIKEVENNPRFVSVGYGGLPNNEGKVELDAGFMDGNTLAIGCIAGAHNIANPIEVAYDLSHKRTDVFLVGEGADKYAKENKFNLKNMLTKSSYSLYLKKKKELEEKKNLIYRGHDTIGCIALDNKKKIVVGTSTSGLFMKHKGRVGDSPIPGSGYYADSKVGAATATGLGEDMLKGIISYEIVSLMKKGYKPQEACEKAVKDLDNKLKSVIKDTGDISVIAMNNKGEWGAASNTQVFSFVVGTSKLKPTVYQVYNKNYKMKIVKADLDWVKDLDKSYR